ncbi:Chromosome segregation ATPase [Nosema bombycis CQ1]|uniref:Chromosome segregation ATPase n=1 Tax=Nosema bombycis (strain CQ1 / CVCC 102059) TaxID=578461 RepID=R0MJN0_NOSB1|nr:Chromosome segregation ATPase [Nosema bombycis CQ1]|eukprot:EOB12993.1 Chromosome segregation ATPase [Nosema bombycis CQ1]
MLEETQQTQSKVEGILERIMGKLEGLEKDKEILEENDKLEKEKRRYEIGYKQREILEINEKIDGRRVGEGEDGRDVDGKDTDNNLNNEHHINNNDIYLDDLHVEFELQQIRKKITQNLKFTNTLTNPPPPSYESKITNLSNQLKDLNEKKLKIKEIYEKNLIELEGLKKLKREVSKGVSGDVMRI